jgi:tRNA nucleotidyltransferase (CCA-adding enzyme)
LRAIDLAHAAEPVAGETSVARVHARASRRGRRHAWTVMRGSLPLGAVTREDLDLAARHDLGHLRLRDLLLGGVVRLPGGASVDRVARELQRRGRSLVVVGTRRGDGWTVISTSDLPPGIEAAPPPTPRLTAALERAISPGAYVTLKRLARVARRRGEKVYVVGGIVRDALLGRSTHDIDVLVEGEVSGLAREIGGSVRVHAAFHTASLRLDDGSRIDLARARKERYARPGVLPDVDPGSLREDLRRRDFTINAIAVPLRERGFGKPVDAFGGVEDLRARRLRILHPLSFFEDPTRALRAVRLSAELGLRLEPATARLARVARDEGVFDRLSSARLRREVEAIFSMSRPERALRALLDNGLLEVVLPGIRRPRGSLEALSRLPGVLRRYREDSPKRTVRGWVVALAVLVRCADPPHVERILQRLEPPRGAGAALRAAASGLSGFLRRLQRMRAWAPSAVHRVCRGETDEFLLAAAAATTRSVVRRAVLRYLGDGPGVRVEITGRDLLDAGVPPGPSVARGLEAARMAVLDGRAPTAAEQLRRALRAARRA